MSELREVAEAICARDLQDRASMWDRAFDLWNAARGWELAGSVPITTWYGLLWRGYAPAVWWFYHGR